MARTKTTLDLKPCPFCGNNWPWMMHYVEWDSELGMVNRYKISCCVTQVEGHLTHHSAILQWNKRRVDESTSARIASSAAKLLRSKKASKAAKAVAASALTQRSR